jgi:ABC-type xylose transport system substrate-binding protein
VDITFNVVHTIRLDQHLVAFFTDHFKDIMTAITDLQAAVAAEDTAIASAITLLNGLKAALDAAIASGNPADLAALSADIGAQTSALAAAVTANTPAP